MASGRRNGHSLLSVHNAAPLIELLLSVAQKSERPVLHVAEKLRDLISATPFATRNGDCAVTASFGVASTGPNGPDISLKVDKLIRAADECLYQSKQEGRNRSSGQGSGCTRDISRFKSSSLVQGGMPNSVWKLSEQMRLLR